MSFTRTQNPSVDDLNTSLIQAIKRDISDAENYQQTVIVPAVKNRYEIYYADKNHYAKKFPQLSKYSSIVSTDVTDTIEWALPSLIKVFTGGDEVVTVQGVSEEDDKNAEIMQKLLVYQLQRQNRFFPLLYNWMKDALITGMGIVKCYWERKEDVQILEQQMNARALMDLQSQAVEILSVDGPDVYGIFNVRYSTPYYIKNSPVIENVLVTELLYSSDAKTLEEANFVAHKKRVTLSYLRERQQQGVYANVENIHPKSGSIFTGRDNQIEEVIGDHYDSISSQQEEARTEVTLYECYTKLDWNNDGILEDLIITIVDDVVLRVEPNFMGRHPFFDISPTRDPHRIWTKRSYADLIGELQDLKVALTRQIIHNIALTNDPKMILAEDSINIDDYIKGRAVIRKKTGHSMNDVAMSMPVNQLSPYSYQMLEYIETQKENRTGITRYNQGLDSRTLNKMCDVNHIIPMADGSFKLLKNIVDGDVLVGQNGKPTTVIKAHEIQLPKKAYSIEFSNGETIRAGGEHLWTIRKQSGVRKTVDTDYIFDYMSKYKQTLYIDRVNKPLAGLHKDLPIDPYFLGLWLGDGGSWQNVLCSEDSEIVEYVSQWAETHGGYIEKTKHQNSGKAVTYRIKDTNLTNICKDLGIRKSRTNTDAVKHIPDVYFTASYEQRLALLQGLMDTDGCHHSGGFCFFTQKEGRLCDDVIRLVKSLGWDVSVKESNPGKLAQKNAKYYNIGISALDNPFRLSRKAKKWKRQNRMIDKVTIKSIVEINPIPMRCLTVDALDGQFCIEYTYTVTHNTASGIQAILGQSTQRLELIARMFAETGIYEMLRFMIGLNQKFIDQETVIRLTNGRLSISPDDLQGNFDLVVNAGISIATKESTQMMLQQILTALMQTNNAGIHVVTPENIYNLFKKWIEAAGFKNYADYITDPTIIQERVISESQIKMQVLASLPPEVVQTYMQTGVIPPQYLLQLPESIQALFGGVTDRQNGFAIQAGADRGLGQSPTNPIGLSSDSGVVGGLSRGDNRVPQSVPRERGNGPPEQTGGVGGF